MHVHCTWNSLINTTAKSSRFLTCNIENCMKVASLLGTIKAILGLHNNLTLLCMLTIIYKHVHTHLHMLRKGFSIGYYWNAIKIYYARSAQTTVVFKYHLQKLEMYNFMCGFRWRYIVYNTNNYII